jgi:hypothetical protein
MRLAWLVAVVVSLYAVLAQAQASVGEVVINGPGGMCLALMSPLPPGGRPAVGTAITLQPCDGSASQRFGRCFGDCQDELFAPGSGDMGVGSGGRFEVVPLHSSTAHIEGSTIQVDVVAPGNPTPILRRACITSPSPPVAGAPLTVATCDGRPEQRFTIAP